MPCPAAPGTPHLPGKQRLEPALERVPKRLPKRLPKLLIERLIERLLPRHCLLCGQLSGGSELCAPCRADLPRAGQACRACAIPLAAFRADPATNPYGALCGRCLRRPPPWDQALAALVYRFPADRLVCRFKFNRDLSAGALLGRELLDAIRRSGQELPDAIVPVPLHRTRHFSRTFNQAELLARHLGRALGIPVHCRLLARSRRTVAQSGLDAAGRRRNLRGAFRLSLPRAPLPARCHIALVDDVLTTGVTLAECSRTLRRAGAARISVWVAARAPIP
jgi:ComF family protein